jgi:hypothetical protein
MAKREIPIGEKPPNNWVVYQIKGKRAVTFIGFVSNAPDKKTAIARAIEEYDVPAKQLIVLRDAVSGTGSDTMSTSRATAPRSMRMRASSGSRELSAKTKRARTDRDGSSIGAG